MTISDPFSSESYNVERLTPEQRALLLDQLVAHLSSVQWLSIDVVRSSAVETTPDMTEHVVPGDTRTITITTRTR